MARLYILCEGQSEQTFVDTVLKDHLAVHQVFVHPSPLIAHRRKAGRVHRGGGRRYIAMKNDIHRFLRQERGGDVFFSTMIDLYAIHSDFPALEESRKLLHLPQNRVEFLEDNFAKDVGDARFIPHIQLHEFEAYLFCEPKWFEYFYDNCSKEVATLREIADSYQSPELIDDGQHTAPSKRIGQVFPDYLDAKPTVGPQLADLIGLEVIRAKCPHFDRWIGTLESLAQRAS